MFGARYKLLLHVKSTHCKETVHAADRGGRSMLKVGGEGGGGL